MSRNVLFAACATAAVLFGLAMGFYRGGSPHLQRLANADEARLQDLNAISTTLTTHRSVFNMLPQSLAEIRRSGSVLRLADPETNSPYEYHPIDDRRFELCAVFSTDNRSESQHSQGERLHGAGRQCFTYPE